MTKLLVLRSLVDAMQCACQKSGNANVLLAGYRDGYFLQRFHQAGQHTFQRTGQQVVHSGMFGRFDQHLFIAFQKNLADCFSSLHIRLDVSDQLFVRLVQRPIRRLQASRSERQIHSGIFLQHRLVKIRQGFPFHRRQVAQFHQRGRTLAKSRKAEKSKKRQRKHSFDSSPFR